MPRILLASSSAYRRRLLESLAIDFEVVHPVADETPLEGEDAPALVARLAEAKARSGARGAGEALVIGCDQVAVLDGAIVGKPGDAATNRHQLERASGRRVEFHTGVCLLSVPSGRAQIEVVAYAVRFRPLSAEQIAAYVSRERAFDCAGGFRSEGLGAALLESMQGSDPSALTGLPLLSLTRMLANEGVDVLLESSRLET